MGVCYGKPHTLTDERPVCMSPRLQQRPPPQKPQQRLPPGRATYPPSSRCGSSTLATDGNEDCAATSNLVAQQSACGGDRCGGEPSAGATTAMDAAIATTATSNLVAQQRACGGDRCDGERSAGATTAVDAAIATTRFAVGDTVPGLGLEITRVVQPWGCHGLKAVYACRRVIQEHAQGQAPPPFSRHSSQWALIQFARSKETATLATIEGVLDREAAWNWAHVPARFPATRHLVTPTTDKYRLVSVVQWCGEHLLEAAARATPRDPRDNDAVPSPSSQGHSLCMQDVWRNLPGLLRTLRVLHLHSLLHKDIAPHNLCFLPGQSPGMGRITLIDFGAVTSMQKPGACSVGVFLAPSCCTAPGLWIAPAASAPCG